MCDDGMPMDGGGQYGAVNPSDFWQVSEQEAVVPRDATPVGGMRRR